MRFSDHFRAMDTGVDVEVDCDGLPLALARVRDLFREHEARFSRFLPASQLSRLNSGDTVVDAHFAAVCRLAVGAYEFTGGLFNPLILAALEAAGYARSFDQLQGGKRRLPLSAPVEQGPGGEGPCGDPGEAVRIDGDSVSLPSGRMDLGGIVKGWTVDQALATLRSDCEAALVNAGGDLACFGNPDGDGWEMSISGPAGQVLWAGQLSGALATSTSARRRWRTDSGAVAHHLIDPRTGLPAASPFLQVSACAAEAWRAEAWAKAVLIGGPASMESALAHGVSLLTLDDEDRSTAWGDWPQLSRGR